MTTDYKNLSIEKKIGQLFFIGLSGEVITDEEISILNNISPGGICLFARNTKNALKTRELLDTVTDILPFQPYLSVDQEGGLVDRLRRINEPLPSAKDVSRSGNTEFTRRLAEISAEAIRILGFNMNFAPVIDVINDSRKGFIMDNQLRTFGNSTSEVIEHTEIYLKALQDKGIIGCLKHFPGIGAVEFDPHEELPSVLLDRDKLFETDVLPYIKHFENQNVMAIMTAHTTFPLFDLQETDSSGKLLPSSLSHNIVTKLLREELKFDNLALTDDLEMGAIVNNYGIGEAAKMSFLAGSDFILICNEKKAILDSYETMLNAVNNGEIPESRIDESLERIFRVRKHLSQPLEFSEKRLEELSLEILDLKKSI